MKKTSKTIPDLRFPEFDDEWEIKRLGEVCIKITDGTHNTPKPTKTGIPYLTAIHIKDGFIEYDKCYYVPKDVHDTIYQRCNPEKGDLLIVNIGAGTATCAINTVDYEFSLKNVAVIKVDKALLSPFFFEQVQRKNSKRIFHELTAGGAQPFLSLKQINKLRIKYPSIPEQAKIANFLSLLDARIRKLTDKKTLLEQYKKGIMQKIFSQQLRFKDKNGNDFADWEIKELGECLDYEQPTKYLVKNTEYKNEYATPVVTAGKTFILGYTNEKTGVYNNLPVIIFDDFTTASKFVTFPFKAKSSAMKILVAKNPIDIKFIYEAMQMIPFEVGGHGRHWISIFSKMKMNLPCLSEQRKIAAFISAVDTRIDLINQQIEQHQIYKKGLLQRMFI